MSSIRTTAAALLILTAVGPLSARDGDPVKGLKATAEVIQKGAAVEIRLTLTNAGDRPLAVNTWLGERAIEVKWTGPDGKPRESNHYEWMKAARIRGLAAEDFVTLAPGRSLVMGPRGRDTGLAITDAAPGKHTLSISYTNKHDGKEHGVAKAWTGTVAAPQVTFTIK